MDNTGMDTRGASGRAWPECQPAGAGDHLP